MAAAAAGYAPAHDLDAPCGAVRLDGTLLDSNWFHTVSWWRALQDAGEDISMARIHPLIGMGSDQLLDTLFGEERKGLSHGHTKHYKPYKRLAAALARAGHRLPLLPGSRPGPGRRSLLSVGRQRDRLLRPSRRARRVPEASAGLRSARWPGRATTSGSRCRGRRGSSASSTTRCTAWSTTECSLLN